MHNDVQVSNRRDKKSEIILSYNHPRGCVDTLNQEAETYSTRRKYRLFHYNNVGNSIAT